MSTVRLELNLGPGAVRALRAVAGCLGAPEATFAASPEDAQALRAAILEALREFEPVVARKGFEMATLEYQADPRTLLGVLDALESVTRPYAAPETVDAWSAQEYLTGLRNAWRPKAAMLRHACASWDTDVEALF